MALPANSLIYLGAFRGEARLAPAAAVPCLVVIGALALIGGLAAITFTKVVGIAFLGEPRTERPAGAHRPGSLMQPRFVDTCDGVPPPRANRASDRRSFV